MTDTNAARAARQICSARKDGVLLDGLAELTPDTMDEGYVLQDAFISQWQDRIVGWKVGATAAKVQQVYGVTEPFSGPFFETTTFTSPARLEAADFGHFCIESEFAFRFAQDLPPREQAYDTEEILDAVATVLPAFELISPRFNTLLQDRAALAAADCGLNGGFVLGREEKNWRDTDFANHAVTLQVDGVEIEQGTGANVLGHPFNVLDWLINHLSRRGITLQAGQIVSTGTCTGFYHIEMNQRAIADFGALGSIEVTFI